MFLVSYSANYEGDRIEKFSTLEEVREWLSKHRSSYDFDLDNVDVIEIARHIDVYNLMSQTL